MLLQYRNIEIDFNESNMTEESIKRIFNPVIDILLQHNAEVNEIIVEDPEYALILIEGNSIEEYSDLTMAIISQMEESGFNTALSDEDYGVLDAINLYL